MYDPVTGTIRRQNLPICFEHSHLGIKRVAKLQIVEVQTYKGVL